MTTEGKERETPKDLILEDLRTRKATDSLANQNSLRNLRRVPFGTMYLGNGAMLWMWWVGHKMNNCPKAAWNKEKNVQGAGPRNPSTTAPQSRPLAIGPAQPNRNSKKPQVRVQFIIRKLKRKRSRIPMQWYQVLLM